VEMLSNLQSSIGISALTLKTQHLLSLHEHERAAFVESQKGVPLIRKTVITCTSTLKKSHSDDDALACLVIGTENCDIFVLHPETFTPIDEVTFPNLYLLCDSLFNIPKICLVKRKDKYVN
jgi:Bardet-Biedl syndrome 1 protein